MSHPCPHWHRIMFVDAKTHLVQGALRDDLIADMTARKHPPNTTYENSDRVDAPKWRAVERVRTYGLDLGGMVHIDEPDVTIKIDNLPLEFRCTQARDVLQQAQRAPERTFASGRPYHKLHGSWHCLVLTPRHHRMLLLALEKAVPEAEAEGLAFYADRRSPIEVLRDANAKARGIAPEAIGPVSAFGRSSADRFASAKRGES